ncbi:chloride channel protein [Cumulibacter manganitolerans]|uniref:chloride channel protein n=1 Tax=Cumulibacter manganitolerans TaxID=1884992 RepID=UPI001E349A62|nr:chloride channel protein [Cumulibacter manganitolerans]
MTRNTHLGDFNVDRRMVLIALLAIPVGALGAVAAWALLRLIGLVTNLCFYGRVSTDLIAPGSVAHPWWLVLLMPVAGGLVIGLMARFGSEKIRGHGMPEAIESILTRGSVVEPKVAILKPVSSAVSIGTGGPFGAEGPIIMTGGAIGSILAQHLHLTADERKTLLVSGAAAGMAATFNSPLAAVLLAVELLLFEWRPRSLVPVSAAVAVAAIVRAPLLGGGPIFPVDTHGVTASAGADLLAVVLGVCGAVVALVATQLVYRAEDLFARLPFHWMWWPAIGGLVIGLGGLMEPRALGVGYDVIDALLTGHATTSLIIGILVVKTLIWSLSLGSGTSGGVLAPIFMIGGALGAAVGLLLPHVFPGFWALLGLAAVVGGVMRSPLTGVVFTLELTQAWSAALPVLIASVTAFAVSVLVLRRSVLTEKIARRGLHLTRDYSTDPLETFFCADVARTDPDSLAIARGEDAGPVLRAHDTLRHAAYVMAESRIDHAPVLDAQDAVVGLVRLPDLLSARRHDLNEATARERPLRFFAGRATGED